MIEPLRALAMAEEGLRTLRQRFSFHLLVAFVCLFPAVLFNLVIGVPRADAAMEMFRPGVLGNPGAVMAVSQRLQEHGYLDWLGMPLFLVGFSLFSLVSVKSALEQHRGGAPTFLECVRAVRSKIGWVVLLDLVFAGVSYFGFLCCCIPGVFVVLYVVGNFAYVQTLMVEENLGIADAIRRSQALLEGGKGAQIRLFGLFFACVFGVGLVAIGACAAWAFATSGDEPFFELVRRMTRAYLYTSAGTGPIFWIFYIVFQHARVAGYVHLARATSGGVGGTHVAEVFA